MRKSVLLLLTLLSTAAAQPSRPAFEVISIKPVKGEVTFSRDVHVQGRRAIGTALTLIDMITTAYGVHYDEIKGGPPWASSDRFSLEATAPAGDGPLPDAEMRQMLQAVLEDRFQLKFRREKEEIPVYNLVVAKGGPKLKPAESDANPGASVRWTDKGMHMEVRKGTMQGLAGSLRGNATDRPVFDQTGLTGYFSYTLDYLRADTPASGNLDTPSIFSALQEQLGLKLDSARGMVEKFVIASAAKPPEN